MKDVDIVVTATFTGKVSFRVSDKFAKEMEELIRQLEACASPRTCPHGRPTMIHLSATQLAKEFGLYKIKK